MIGTLQAQKISQHIVKNMRAFFTKNMVFQLSTRFSQSKQNKFQ